MGGLKKETASNFDGYDDFPVFIIENLTRAESFGLETEIHDFLMEGHPPLSPHESFMEIDTGFRVPCTKEWFFISDKYTALIATLYCYKYKKRIRKFNPY